MSYCSHPYSRAQRETIFGRLETYLGDFGGSMARGTADISPTFGTDEGPTHEVLASMMMMMMGPSERRLMWEDSSTVQIGDTPAQMEVVATDASLGTEGSHANEVGP
jgi:hypothetical protein